MNKKAAHFGIVLLAIVVIILGTIIAFYFSQSDSKTGEAPPNQELSISGLKLCNSVDENFYCDEKANGAFKVGSSFYIYFLIENLEAKKVRGQYRIGFVEARDMLNVDGSVIPEEAGITIVDTAKNVGAAGFYNNYVKNEIVSYPSDKEGAYTVIITVEDKFSGRKDTKELTFTLEK